MTDILNESRFVEPRYQGAYFKMNEKFEMSVNVFGIILLYFKAGYYLE